MLEDVPQDIVFKTLNVCVCVCVSQCVPCICVRENLYLHFLIIVLCVCVQLYCNREGASHTSLRVDGTFE